MNRYCFILVDAFSKWVEIYPIRNRTSSTVADCFFDFVKRFGAPIEVRSDKGKEFEGEFNTLMHDMRVKYIHINRANP